ncbi:hypothetical protein ACFFQW_19495 [Umezawaea endophytica]|uniref:Uncharacterized protein n=1 Tax=Umezawaea endophytica TaxID=1654476 RepID=A0A9X2VNC0_9PSEU|nr:hypothetical protein [Umezawaea endophytica]MCS7479592.1 hypothetical protein [Umezawaea endophytica]
MDRDDVDEVLAVRGAESDRIAQSLLAMDDHPGHDLLDSAEREAVAALWAQFEAYRRVLQEARDVRDRAERPTPADLAVLEALLTGPAVELDRRSVPLARRGLTGPAVIADRVALDELVTRMRTGYADVVDTLAAAVARHAAAEAELRELVPVRAEAHRLRALVREKIAVGDLPAVPDTLAGCRALVANLAGLLERRTELRGRLEAYRAKATGLGHAENAALSVLHRAAHDVLFTAPCDLPEATRAVGRYQRAVLDLAEAR